MLKHNEGRACDAIIRHLEDQAGAPRANLRWPEAEPHPFPIELAFTIGKQLYALEHTGIEPFEGHMKMEAEARWLFTPIVEGLKGKLDEAAVFELEMPVNAPRARPTTEIPSIQKALIDWVVATAATVPKPLSAYAGCSVGPFDDVPGVPFTVSLNRFEPPSVPGRHFEIKHLIAGGGQARGDRIKKAIEHFPKLAAWKRYYGARTILVLECNDRLSTNPQIVTETFVPQAIGRLDRPDETYLVFSCMDPWHAWPILLDDKTYFDLAQQHRGSVGWQIDQHALSQLTRR